MTTLQFERAGAKLGGARHLVVLLHGYGADGSDLLSLHEFLSDVLPDTAFVAPNAPFRCTSNPFGFEWFPIPWIDGSSETEAAVAAGQSYAILNDWLDEMADRESVDASRTALVGFSQGTMIALNVIPRRRETIAGLVGFSGTSYLLPKGEQILSRPPVLLVHGENDEMVPSSNLQQSADALEALGFETATHLSRGIGHQIGPDGLAVAREFLVRHLIES
ncbi:MAG: dienelactone hydrolase family protein [Rhodobacteraceae bacterium]|nr:dienelactone hydrolase family protein [Paracoccaceae bacterium]MCY4139092.1 dienelactone hydrolase family protein [Paracoccaceae bacterium]